MSSDIYVPGEGNKSARIVFIGEAPGKDEERSKRPFIGHSGSILRNTAASVGIPASHTYITNVCHYRPPYNNIEKFVKIKKHGSTLAEGYSVKVNKKVGQGIVELYRDLAEIKPNVVVPLGNVALWSLTGEMKITKRRGSIMSATFDEERFKTLAPYMSESLIDSISAIQDLKVIPTVHPAFVLRKMEWQPIFQTDLQRVMEESFDPEVNLPEREYLINPPGPALDQAYKELMDGDLLSYDIECVGGTTYCVGFANDPSWCLVLTTSSGENLDIIRNLLASPVPKVAQNGLFDESFLHIHDGIQVNNYAHDTMVAGAVAYPEYPRGLDFHTSIHTKEPFYKDEGKNWDSSDAEDIERFLTYNGKDACVTLEILLSQLENDLKDPANRSVYDEIMQNEVPVYIDQMIHGIRMDPARVEKHRRELTEESKEFQEALDQVVLKICYDFYEKIRNDPKRAKLKTKTEKFIRSVANGMGTFKGGLNVYSYPDVKFWLYTILGLPVKYKRRKSGKKTPTTDEYALTELYTETKDASLLVIIKIRHARKRISSYLNVKTDHNNYTYFSANPVKTETGRSSYSKTIITNYGNNKQTIPHELRDIYPAEDGYEMAYLDLSQAEARIVAYSAGIQKMIYAFEHGIDLHKQTAEGLLDVPMDQQEEYPHRYIGKQSNHAFNYEMGPYKFFAQMTKKGPETNIWLTRSECKKLRNKHLDMYPGLQRYWDMIKEMLYGQYPGIPHRTVINPLGRKRFFPGRLNAAKCREAYSDYAQGTVARLLRRGMGRTHKYLQKTWRKSHPHTRILLEVHDAILIQYPLGAADTIIPKVISLMTIPFEINGKEITIPVDAARGPSWGELEDYAPEVA